MELIYKDLSYAIIGAAIDVHKDLRPGMDEKLYENALAIEFAERGIHFQQQPQYDVHYKGRFIGKLIPDFVVEDKVIVDPKVVETFTNAHEAQMIGYLRRTGLSLALLLNFKYSEIKIQRIVSDNRTQR